MSKVSLRNTPFWRESAFLPLGKPGTYLVVLLVSRLFRAQMDLLWLPKWQGGTKAYLRSLISCGRSERSISVGGPDFWRTLGGGQVLVVQPYT